MLSLHHVVVDSVFDVTRRVGRTEEPLVVGLVLGEQQACIAFARQNLQDVFTMPSVASARKYLSRWHAWVSTCDLLPMKKAASTIMAKADEILRSISSNLSNGLLEAINGNVQAAKRKAKGYRTKHNLKLMVYLIAGGVLDALPT